MQKIFYKYSINGFLPRANCSPMFVLLIIILLSGCQQANRQGYQIEKSAIEQNAMVVSAHPLASKIGVDVIKMGGNAVDATIATQFALAVVYPRAGNIGGGGFMVIRTAAGEFSALDFREKAPAAAHRDMYLDEEGEVRDSLSRYGNLSIGVPGTVDGLITAWERYGNVSDFGQLIDPAIQLAEFGFKLSKEEAERLNYYKKDFVAFNKHPIAYVSEVDWQPGDLLVQKELAKTLKRIKKEGRDGFYKGEIADKIAVQMKNSGGLITKEDLENYSSVWRDPISVKYKKYRVVSMPPPSSGGIALGQLLKLVEPYNLRAMGFHTRESVHLMVEAARRVYADRAKHLGDSDFYPVPDLLDSAYLVQRMSDFDSNKATPSDSISGGNKRIKLESFETTHTSVVDDHRMAVALTTTLNSNFGSKVVIAGDGFFMNNEMDDFSAKPGVANQFGLVGGEANAIQPGKRMLSSMTPTIVEKEGELFMVLGSPGGSTIITSVFQVFLNVAEFDMDMADAVGEGRFHHQWLPDFIIIEKNTMDSSLISQLKKMGHHFDSYDKIGLVKAILQRNDGKLEGAGDPRSGDDVEGY